MNMIKICQNYHCVVYYTFVHLIEDSQNMGKGIGTIFLPHFGALAAARHHDLETEEIIVHNGACVTSASWPLLESGLILGDTLHRIRALFPHAQLVLRDPTVEEIQWDYILRQLYRITPQIQPIVDQRLIGRWLHIQGFTRTALAEHLETLHAPAGYAANATMSMIGAATAPPGQLHIVGYEEETRVLSQIPTRHLTLFGFAAAIVDLLAEIGLGTLNLVQELSLRQLRAQFQNEGVRLYTLLHPPNVSAAIKYWDPQSVSTDYAVEWSIHNIQQLHQLVAQATRSVLGQTSSCPRTLSIEAHYRTGLHEATRQLKTPTRDVRLLTDSAINLFQMSRHPSVDMHGFTLSLGRLCTNSAIQTDLFAQPELEHLATVMERRFPGKLCQPVAVARAFVPEAQYELTPLFES